MAGLEKSINVEFCIEYRWKEPVFCIKIWGCSLLVNYMFGKLTFSTFQQLTRKNPTFSFLSMIDEIDTISNRENFNIKFSGEHSIEKS